MSLGDQKLSQSGKERAQGWKPVSLSSLSRGGILQRKCACENAAGAAGTCTECQQRQKSSLQRKAEETKPGTGVPPIVHEVLNSSGQPLDKDTRAFMESRFGQDFSQVRVHTDGKATESAKAVNALA